MSKFHPNREPMNLRRSPGRGPEFLEPPWPESPPTEEQWDRFSKFHRLADMKAEWWARMFRRPELEEVFRTEAYAATLRACIAFDPSRGGSLAGGVAISLKEAYRRVKTIAQRTGRSLADSPGIPGVESIPDRQPHVQCGDSFLTESEIESWLAILTPTQKRVFTKFHLEGLRLFEVARELGMRRQQAAVALERCHKKIARSFPERSVA